MSTAKKAPITEPTIAGTINHIPSLKRKRVRGLLLTLPMAVRVCTMAPTLLVTLATSAGRPVNINMDKVIAEPLPARVLMMPAANPPKKSSI